jgi:ParB family transcriptional regulator, chromosome partitioning protein
MSKNSSRRVLGRGLASLIPVMQDEEPGTGASITEIDAAMIVPNPYQPRTEFDDQEIQELAESIRAQGLLQPILLRPRENSAYEIISGERRFRAMKNLGWEKIPCIVKPSLSDRDMMEMALVENIQREDLNEIDKADAYQRLLSEYNYTHEALSVRIGKSRATITNALRLRTLPPEIQQMVRKNQISMGHARALLSLENDKHRIELAKKIVDEGLSVRAVEKEVQQPSAVKQKRKKPTQGKTSDPILNETIARLQYRLGTAVTLRAAGSGGRGTITIEYYSDQDLVRIFDLLLPSNSGEEDLRTI